MLPIVLEKNAIAVAELTMGHLLNLDRRISDNVADLREGKWNKKKFSKARGLFQKKLAIIGLGSCGLETLKKSKIVWYGYSCLESLFLSTKAKELGVHYAASPQEAATNAHALYRTSCIKYSYKRHYIFRCSFRSREWSICH